MAFELALSVWQLICWAICFRLCMLRGHIAPRLTVPLNTRNLNWLCSLVISKHGCACTCAWHIQINFGTNWSIHTAGRGLGGESLRPCSLSSDKAKQEKSTQGPGNFSSGWKSSEWTNILASFTAPLNRVNLALSINESSPVPSQCQRWTGLGGESESCNQLCESLCYA